MRPYVSHSATFLLALTLVVGFYEGRRIALGTAKALSSDATEVVTDHSERPGADRATARAERASVRAAREERVETLAERRAQMDPAELAELAERRAERLERRGELGSRPRLDRGEPGTATPMNRTDRVAAFKSRRAEARARLAEELGVERAPGAAPDPAAAPGAPSAPHADTGKP